VTITLRNAFIRWVANLPKLTESAAIAGMDYQALAEPTICVSRDDFKNIIDLSLSVYDELFP
jgi:hypothetical protein